MDDLEAAELNHDRFNSEDPSRHNKHLKRRPTPTAAELAVAAAAAAAQPVRGWKCIICHESGDKNDNDNESSKASISSSLSSTCGGSGGSDGNDQLHHPPVGPRQPLVARCGHVACKGCWAQWKRSDANRRQVRARAAELAAGAQSHSANGTSGSSSSSGSGSSHNKSKNNNNGDEDAAMLCPVCHAPIPLGSLRFLVASKKQ